MHPSLRGSLVILPGIFMTFGQLVSWILGYFLSWRTTAYVLIAPPLLLMLLFISFPESPYWLVEKSKLKLAKKSLEFYRGNQYNVAEELFEISQRWEISGFCLFLFCQNERFLSFLSLYIFEEREREETKTRYFPPKISLKDSPRYQTVHTS